MAEFQRLIDRMYTYNVINIYTYVCMCIQWNVLTNKKNELIRSMVWIHTERGKLYPFI